MLAYQLVPDVDYIYGLWEQSRTREKKEGVVHRYIGGDSAVKWKLRISQKHKNRLNHPYQMINRRKLSILTR